MNSSSTTSNWPKAAGIQFLRIHIKAEEPRRLYWADKLGMLIMQDMPSASFQNPSKRSAWEETMRATVGRDRNHPSIFAWVAFNETWGLSYSRNAKPPYQINVDNAEVGGGDVEGNEAVGSLAPH